MNRLLVMSLSTVALAVGGCEPSGKARVVGSGAVITATPIVEAFDEVRFVGGFRVEVAVGGEPALAITTDDNIMPFIGTSVEGSVLTVRLTERVKPSDANAVAVAMPSLSRFSIEGAATVTIHDVAGPSFALTVEGAGAVAATGAVDELTLEVDGSGSIDALALEAKSVSVSIRGAGSADVHAVDSLDVSLAGLGSVRYEGDPQITKAISGLGIVTKK